MGWIIPGKQAQPSKYQINKITVKCSLVGGGGGGGGPGLNKKWTNILFILLLYSKQQTNEPCLLPFSKSSMMMYSEIQWNVKNPSCNNIWTFQKWQRINFSHLREMFLYQISWASLSSDIRPDSAETHALPPSLPPPSSLGTSILDCIDCNSYFNSTFDLVPFRARHDPSGS